jgi:hypothetical protein
MKIYVPWRVCLEDIDCEVEQTWEECTATSWNVDFWFEYYSRNPNYRNVETDDTKIKYELLVSKYYVEVNTVDKLLDVLSYFNLYDQETKSLRFEED